LSKKEDRTVCSLLARAEDQPFSPLITIPL
jgi:hypothetical protein